MGKEHTVSKWIKLDVDDLKQEFLQGCQDLNPSLVIKHTKQTPGYKRRVANKHKEHEHHKLVVYWTRVVVFELLFLLWTTLKISLLCLRWTALKSLLTSHSRKIANIIRRGVIYIFLLICVSTEPKLWSLSCLCLLYYTHNSKTNLNSAEDATRGPHAKVLTIDCHWIILIIAPEFLYEHEDDWPQGKCIVYKERSE